MVDEVIYSFVSKAPVVLSHPHLTDPAQVVVRGKPTGKLRYSASFVMDPASDDFVAVKAQAAACAKAQWPGVPLNDGQIKFPFKMGDKEADKRVAKGKSDGEFQRGKVILKAASEFEPALAHFVGGVVTDYVMPAQKNEAKKDAFFGAHVYFKVTFRAYDLSDGDDGAKKFVTAYLDQVLVTGKGTKMSGARTASETFSGYVGGSTVEDPTAGMDDDEIPF